jgi:hypothetical protein
VLGWEPLVAKEQRQSATEKILSWLTDLLRWIRFSATQASIGRALNCGTSVLIPLLYVYRNNLGCFKATVHLLSRQSLALHINSLRTPRMSFLWMWTILLIKMAPKFKDGDVVFALSGKWVSWTHTAVAYGM